MPLNSYFAAKQINNLRRKNKASVIHKTGRFDNVDSAVIINTVSKAIQNCKHCFAYTADDDSSIYVVKTSSFKTVTADIFFPFKLFSSHIYCILKLTIFVSWNQGCAQNFSREEGAPEKAFHIKCDFLVDSER